MEYIDIEKKKLRIALNYYRDFVLTEHTINKIIEWMYPTTPK